MTYGLNRMWADAARVRGRAQGSGAARCCPRIAAPVGVLAFAILAACDVVSLSACEGVMGDGCSLQGSLVGVW